MGTRLKSVLLIGANLLIPIAILTFASGFFPYKPFLPGLAKYDGIEGEQPFAPFDKVIFMVVDALRSDFVYSNESGFTFTQSLIRDGAALPFTAHATSPTITMPRVKAMTTGSIPSFLDVILNFAESDSSSSLATQDTWLAQMKAKRTGKMIMYGDDTWLKLFPETFDRADGTSSFFVSDFTEVDNNVTRHVPKELESDDWNTMVLHFLGLDHIGHKAGPKSPNMIPKQEEMDGIVSQIYTAMETQKHLDSTLLVLAGDHGMNDAGNHGGSAPGETSPALVFVSPKIKQVSSGVDSPAPFQEDFQYYVTVEQSDIVPTLAALLGFPVPKNNLGAFIPNFLSFWMNSDDKFKLIYQNAKQMSSILAATSSFESVGKAPKDCSNLGSNQEELVCEWSMITHGKAKLEPTEQSQIALQDWLRKSQSTMSSAASNYDLRLLFIGKLVAVIGAVLALSSATPTFMKSIPAAIPFFSITLAYGAMMFASSFVEEEQHFWYWTASGWLAILFLKGSSAYVRTSGFFAFSTIGILAALRITRRWNQTGQKFAGDPDVARTFFSSHNLLLWDAVGATYFWNMRRLATQGFSRLPRTLRQIFVPSLLIAAVTFKLAFTNEDAPELVEGLAKTIVELTAGVPLVLRARLVFFGIAFATMYTFHFETGSGTDSASIRKFHDLLFLFLITQSRATNIPLLLILEAQFYLLENLNLSLIEITTTSLLLQHVSFFAFGGSNAISSIDLSSAYNGVSDYNILAVGLLTFISNWTGPIFWTSATTILLLRHQKSRPEQQNNVLQQHIALLTVFVTCSLFFVMAACTLLRTHLFIWTVFSPKYLYSMAWSLGQHLGVNVVLGSLLFWMGSR